MQIWKRFLAVSMGLVCASASAQSTNKIVNPIPATYTTAGWTLNLSQSAVATMTVPLAFDGGRASAPYFDLDVTTAGPNDYNVEVASTPFGVVSGQAYTLALLMRAQQDGRACVIKVQKRLTPYTLADGTAPTSAFYPALTKGWVRYDYSFTATITEPDTVLVIQCGLGRGHLYFTAAQIN